MTSEELCGYVEEVDKWVKRDGFHAKNINAYVQASKAFLSNFDDVPTAMELTRKSKMGLQQIVYNQRKESILDTAQTVQCLGVHVPEIDLMWECLRIESPFLFDSYMLFLEKDRQPKDKFYYPRRDCLQKLGIIQDLQDLEDDVLDIYSLSLPPGTGKTTLEKFFATWVIGRWSREYSLFFSHSDDITRMFYDGVLAITTDNMEYRWDLVFPNLKLRKTDAARQQIDFGKEKAFWSLQCSSRGSSNAGKVRASKYLYVDDLIGGIEEAMNPAFLDKLYRIYSTDAKQRKLNQYTKELHVATRWSTRDVIGRLQILHEGNPRARFKAVPDIDPKTGKSNFNYRINGMNEEFFHDQEMAMDDVTYRCLYKNEPIEREGRLYTEDNIMTYLTMPAAEPDAVVSIVDTKSKGTDFLVCPCFKQYGDKYYLDISSICTDSSDYGVQYERIARMYVSQGVQSAEFESNAGGDRVAFEVDKLVKEMGGTCNITTKYTETNKETRIIIFADWIKKHVYFPDKSLYNPKSDVGTFMYWLFAYTISGKNIHDDVPDCLANFAKHVDNMSRVAKVEVPLNPYKMYSRGY